MYDIHELAKVGVEEIYSYEEHTNDKELSDQGEIINNCSIGLNRILNWLASNFNNSNKVHYEFYLINLITMIRNCFSPDTSDKEIYTKVDTDIDQLRVYISGYSYNTNIKPVTLFYLPIYAGLGIHKRKHTGQNLRIEELANGLMKYLPKKLTDISSGNIKTYVQVFSPKLPHLEIKALASRIAPRGLRSNTLMLSHCPVDFHIHRYMKYLQLIESYTANIVSAKDFGKKLFKKEIPFNPYTHLTLGDSINIDPIAKRNDKKKVLEVAKTRNWKIRTEYEILNDLITRCGIDKKILTTLKF